MMARSSSRAFLLLLLAAVTPAPAFAADLTVPLVDVSQLAVDCRTLAGSGPVSATVRNQGQTSTGSGFDVLFFEDADLNGAWDAGTDLLLGVAAVAAPLGAGEETVVGVAVAANFAFAGSPVHAFADSDGDVAETDETNNVGDSGSDCQFMPPPGGFAPVLEWAWTGSGVEPAALNVMMTPAVIDLDADGVPDVVFGSTASNSGGLVEIGFLRALRGDTGAELWTVTDPARRINTTSSVAAGDLDLDGRPEVVACDMSGSRLVAFEHDGAFKWVSPPLEAVNWGAPSIADLDEDGSPEIVIGRQALRADGSLWWTGAAGRGSSGPGAISIVADVDRDGSPDVVAGNTVYRANGGILWLNPTLPDGLNAVANFDGDPFAEIVLVGAGKVWLLEHDGTVVWGPFVIPGGGQGGPPTVADYDGDGQVEIGVAGANRYVVIETNGALRWAAPTQDGSSNRTGSSVFDFNGDGSAEVVYHDELRLRVYRGTDGFVLFETPSSSCTWHEYALVADVDADGNAEIVAVANTNCGYGPQRGVFVYGDAGDSWVATRRLWNQHAYHITNIDDDGTVPADEADNWLSPPGSPYNNYRQNVLTGRSPLIAPDLTASYLRLDREECPDAVGITARIGNGGANVAPAPIPVAFYDGDPDLGGTLLGVAMTTVGLAPGAYEDVTLAVSPPPVGPHTIWAVADDDGASGGAVSECDETNNACSAEFSRFCVIPAKMDVKPTSCPNPMNVKSQGILPVALLGTADFDVHQVDPATVRLMGVAPKRWSLEDVATPFDGPLCECTTAGPDGIPDLGLKFVTQLIVEASVPFANLDMKALTLTGNLYDGSPFEARDCVRIQGFADPEEPGTAQGGDAWIRLEVAGRPDEPVRDVTYSLPEAGSVRLCAYDVRGRLVDEIIDAAVQPAGDHGVRWEAGRRPSGIYFLRLEVGTASITRKVAVRR